MYRINRLLTNICSERLLESREFYTKLFDFQIDFESEWFIHLISHSLKLELGIIDRKSQYIPECYQKSPVGVFITFVVDDSDTLYKIVKREGYEIVEEPHDTFYGQSRFLIKDPNGMLIDISSPIPIKQNDEKE